MLMMTMKQLLHTNLLVQNLIHLIIVIPILVLTLAKIIQIPLTLKTTLRQVNNHPIPPLQIAMLTIVQILILHQIQIVA